MLALLVSWWRSPRSRLLCPGSGFWLQRACMPQMLGDFGLIYFCFGGSLPCTSHWSATRLQPPLFHVSFFQCECCNLLLLKKKQKQTNKKPLKIKQFIFLQPQNAVSYRLHVCTSQLYFLWLEAVLGVIFDEKIQWNQIFFNTCSVFYDCVNVCAFTVTFELALPNPIPPLTSPPSL